MSEYTNSVITIETLPAMRVACLRVVSPTPEDDGTVLMDRWVASQHIPGPIRAFGFDTDVTAQETKNGLRGYEMWRTVPDHIVQSGGVTIQDFPGGLYMVMTLDRCFEGPFTRIPESWKQLHDRVIHHEEYQSASHQWLEEAIEVEYGSTLKLYHPIMPVPRCPQEIHMFCIADRPGNAPPEAGTDIGVQDMSFLDHGRSTVFVTEYARSGIDRNEMIPIQTVA